MSDIMKQAWRATQNERSPFISFDCEDGVHVFVITHIKEAELVQSRLKMWWNQKVIEIEGASLLQFLNDFTEERVNHVQTDGEKITSIRCLNTDRMH
jgi:hypothetical protein